MPRFTGNPEAQRQAPERVWERSRGWTTVDVWIGSQASIYGLVPALQAGYDNIDISTPDGVVYKVRASVGNANDGAEEAPVNTWELLGAGLQEPITKHPGFTALPPDHIAAIEDFLSGNQNPEFPPTLIPGTPGWDFFTMLRRDQPNFQASQFILRHTQTFSSRVVVNPTMSNANKLWTTAQLPSDISPSVRNAINNIPAQTVPTGYLYRWLFQTPTVSQSLNSKTQVTEEWWLYAWPTLLYPSVT